VNARRRTGSGRFPGFHLQASKLFWAFASALPVLGLAALNTGNNALYLALSLALGALAASGALSRHSLGHLAAALEPPGDIFAGAPASVRVVVRNSSRWLPAVGVVCRLRGAVGQVLVPTVPPRGEVRVGLQALFPRRGLHPLPLVQLEVRLPLPFFVKAVKLSQPGELLVFPQRIPPGPPRFAGLVFRDVETARGNQQRGADVEQLREFRSGDDRRDIHWKQTARQQRFIVMERRERSLPSGYLVLDRQLPRRGDAIWEARFESLVSEVAAAAQARLRRGAAVGLVVGSAVTPPATGSTHIRHLLGQLALVKAVGPGEDPLPSALCAGPVYRLVEGK